MLRSDTRIDVINPSELEPSTPIGMDMAALSRYAARGFSIQTATQTGPSPAHVLNHIFAEGTESGDGGKGRLKFFRGYSIGALLGCFVAAAIFPWTLPLIALGLVGAAIAERLRCRFKRSFEHMAAQAPEARRTLDEMLALLDTATKEQARHRTAQSRDQLEEATVGLCSLWSRELGYLPSAFDGQRVLLAQTFFGSPSLKRVNSSLEVAIRELDRSSPPGDRTAAENAKGGGSASG